MRLTTELPQTEIQDEALKTQFRDNSHAEKAPQWLDVDDTIMEERMSKDEADRSEIGCLEQYNHRTRYQYMISMRNPC